MRTVVADARDFILGRRFALIIVPMQTIQLLPERAGFLAAARAHLAPGGLLAMAISGALETFDAAQRTAAGRPTSARLDGWRFASQPTAVRAGPTARASSAAGSRSGRTASATDEVDVIELAHVTRRRARGRGRRRGPAPRAAPQHPADGPARRLRGGAAAWLTRRCACARSIPT